MSQIHLDETTIRPLATQADFQACVALQHATWGEGFGECVPPSILLAVQKVGGIAAGAFDPAGELLGFVFGMSGLRDGRPAHWSDMLAVRRDVRGTGLGVGLKAYQRERLLELGIEVAYWTYDPLVARNAHININRLGALPEEYVTDMYGEGTGSPLHSGLGTDRFVVKWELRAPGVEAALSSAAGIAESAGAGRAVPIAAEAADEGGLEEAPLVASELAGRQPQPAESDLLDVPRVRVEVPRDIQRIKAESPAEAAAWRSATRRAFLHYLERGHRVAGFLRTGDPARCFYLLERETGAE